MIWNRNIFLLTFFIIDMRGYAGICWDMLGYAGIYGDVRYALSAVLRIKRFLIIQIFRNQISQGSSEEIVLFRISPSDNAVKFNFWKSVV